MENHYNKLTQKQIALENQNSISELTEKMVTLEKKIDRVLFFFNSDADTKSEGFIEKSNRHDVEIKDLQSYKREVKVASGVITVITTFIIGIVISIINWIFK